MDETLNFKSLQDKIQASLVATTRKVNSIANQDLAFRRSVDPEAGEQLDEQREKLLSLASSLINTASSLVGGRAAKAKKPIELEDADDVDDQWQNIVDALDIALEKADTCIDDYTGLVKRKDAPTTEMVRGTTTSQFNDSATSTAPNTNIKGPDAKKTKPTQLDRSLRYANIVKPQKAFEVPPDNFESGPWKPILTNKPHAIVPLQKSLSKFQDEDGETQYDYLLHLLCLCCLFQTRIARFAKKKRHEQRVRNLRRKGTTRGANGSFRYKHPYETEILQMKYPQIVYEKRDAIPYTPVEKSAPVYVETLDGVIEMLEELKQAKEVAVDLEHHDFRSYHGLLSLMQISTREKDWIVDTLKPWRRRLEVLNEVFADPGIIKVFHGAFMDMVWLQRDLGIYVVGLFDTFHAAEALMYPSKSLAYLLKKFADFEADKRYQMADWRIRPLPKEMLYYARSDTHYLLYVYDMMRNELVKQSVRGDPMRDLIERTLQRSKDTALQRYEAYTIDSETGKGTRGWFNSINRIPNTFNRQQFSVFRALHRWRDETSRREDESPIYLMSNQLLIDISRAMPESAADLRRLFTNVCPPVRKAVDQLVAVIRDAREKGVNDPTILEFIKANSSSASFPNMTLGGISRSAGAGAQDDADMPDAIQLRGDRSQLWGRVPLSTIWDKVTKVVPQADDDRIAVPWSAFVANAQLGEDDGSRAYEQPKGEEMDNDDDGGAPVAEVAQNPTVVDKEFTLRVGRSDGATANVEDSSDSSEEESDEEEKRKARKQQKKEERRQLKAKLQDDKAARKAEEKVARKAEKKSRRAAGAAVTAEEGEGSKADGDESDEDQPFDYSKAQSVMRGQQARGKDGGGAKVFDPYVSKTTAQGPKPARRMNFEKAGKTATFKK